MYTETVEYWDDLCPESYKVVLPHYNLKLKKAKKIDDNTTLITVSAKVLENLKNFLDDLEEGDLEPLDVLSRACKTDEKYVDTLQAAIKSFS